MFPTDIGMVVTDFLIQHFAKIMDYGFTASVEEQFDTIAEGNLKRQTMIKDFYTPFDAEVNKTVEKADRASGERILGKDPKTGQTILVRIGRYGPMVQLGTMKEVGENSKPQYSSIPRGMSMETMTLNDALKCFELPRNLGEREGKDLIVAIGKFGPYVKWGTIFASIKKTEETPDDDPYTISYERAVEVMQDKIQLEKEKHINEFDYEGHKLEILKGRRGPYIKYQKKNYKIPKSQDAKSLTLDECVALMGGNKKG